MKNSANHFLVAGCLLLALAASAIAQVSVTEPTLENLKNPIGIDATAPRFSWKLTSSKRNVLQTAYEINVAASAADVTRKPLWASGKINSDQSVWVPYAGTALESGKKYYWRVRVWDNSGKTSAWSEVAFWQMGLLNSADWKARWIQSQVGNGETSPLFRKTFSISKKIASATAFITAQGLYEASINGKRVGDAYLTPGWTSYNNRLQYQQYDVTNLIITGSNAVGAMLGNGWYKGFIGFNGQRDFYGKELGLLFQLEIIYADGTKELILSDGSWKTSTGSILNSEIYHGEIIDARLEQTGWNTASFDDSKWDAVKVKTDNKVNLIATYNEPIRKHETFRPVKIFTTPKGDKVIDFGQNLVGWVVVNVNGKELVTGVVKKERSTLQKWSFCGNCVKNKDI